MNEKSANALKKGEDYTGVTIVSSLAIPETLEALGFHDTLAPQPVDSFLQNIAGRGYIFNIVADPFL